MALTGDRYVAEFEGHTIELVRNKWVQTLSLSIDGIEVARQSCNFPRCIRLAGTLERSGKSHEVVAKSIPRYFFWTDDSIEVDGDALPLTQTK